MEGDAAAASAAVGSAFGSTTSTGGGGAGGGGHLFARLTFTQGFIAGQLTFIVVALIVIRYVIFEDSSRQAAPHAKRGARTLPKREASKREKGGNPSSSGASIKDAERQRPPPRSAANRQLDVGAIMADIMSKVHYEMDSHASESIDWINIIAAQAVAGYRQDILAGGWTADAGVGAERRSKEGRVPQSDPDMPTREERTARDWMEDILNSRTTGRGMSFLDPIQVTHVDFGESYPIFSNAKVRPADDMGRMRIEVDIDYSDCVSLAIETKLLINVPRPRFAVLPISLGLNLERFSGTLAIELFSSTPSTVLPQSQMQPPPRSRHEVHISLHPDFELDASATSLVGSRAKLQDVPKIEQLLVGRVRSFIHDRFVWPKYWSLTLPNLIPRDVGADAAAAAAAARASALGNRGPEQQHGALPNGAAERAGMMRVDGPDNGAADHNNAPDSGMSDQQDGIFFETAPPLFPGMFQHGDDRREAANTHRSNGAPAASVPGSLPAVEAWRSQAAALSAGRASASAARNRTLNAAQPRTFDNPAGGATASAAPRFGSGVDETLRQRHVSSSGAPASAS